MIKQGNTYKADKEESFCDFITEVKKGITKHDQRYGIVEYNEIVFMVSPDSNIDDLIMIYTFKMRIKQLERELENLKVKYRETGN